MNSYLTGYMPYSIEELYYAYLEGKLTDAEAIDRLTSHYSYGGNRENAREVIAEWSSLRDNLDN